MMPSWKQFLNEGILSNYRNEKEGRKLTYNDFKNTFETILEKLENKDSFEVVNDQTGTPTYVKDFAIFLIEILDRFSLDELKNMSGIYHFANRGKTTWYKLARQTQRYKRRFSTRPTRKCKIKKIKTEDFYSNDTRPRYSPLSVKETEKKFNYKNNRAWKMALKECVKKYIKNERN